MIDLDPSLITIGTNLTLFAYPSSSGEFSSILPGGLIAQCLVVFTPWYGPGSMGVVFESIDCFLTNPQIHGIEPQTLSPAGGTLVLSGSALSDFAELVIAGLLF